MKVFVKKILSKFGIEITRYQPRAPERVVVSLRPQGANKGNVLLSYDVLPFLLKKNNPILNSHHMYWECVEITKTFLNLDYCVDIIHYNNEYFTPKKPYFLFTGLGMNFERISKLCGDDCIKVLHIAWNHWSFHNSSQYERILALKFRKQICLKPRRLSVPNLTIELADEGKQSFLQHL
jgi:hypothetical protein